LLLWDVGGVLLSNGWDRTARAAAVQHFGLDAADFEQRHARVESDFERGRIDSEGYLAATVFYIARPFSRESFRQFMLARSSGNPAALAVARALRREGAYVMAALNNESRELNEYRIRTFRLQEVFHAFFSSCYTGYRKPEPEAYRYALMITGRTPDESLFLDDRPENIEAAAGLGIGTVQVRDPSRVGEDLTLAGVAWGKGGTRWN
jgi:putative hydrolase of the HAD superfamily